MLVVGLTGGIASGKSAVADLFAELDITIIDTDIIARQLVEPGQNAYQKIVDHFGTEVVNSDGQLNRAQLRQKIFTNPDEKQWLELLLHPLIRNITAQRIQLADSNYCIVVIPLLYETWPNPLLDRVLVVDCTPELQLQRLIQRDKLSDELAHSIIAQQASRTERLSLADDIIENNDNLTVLTKIVRKMDSKFRQILNNAL